MDMVLKGKVAAVTGASSGIGKAVAELFARNGARTAAVSGKNIEAVDNLVATVLANGGEAHAYQCDITQEEQVQRLVEKIVTDYGQIDVWVNSAGIIGPALPLDRIISSDWDRMFAVNVRGTYLCCKYCLAHMSERGRGNIINMSSTAGLRASLISAAYGATKGAIISMTKSMALSYASKGIRINCICPGTIETPMAYSFFDQESDTAERDKLIAKFERRHPLGRFGKAEEVAQGALYLASEASSFVTGINLVIDGGISL